MLSLLKKKEGKLAQCFAAFSAHIGGMWMGACIFWTATALPNIRDSGDLGNLSLHDESWISSVNFLGAITASPIAGFILEKFGRRKSILLLTLPCVFGWIIMTFSTNVLTICIGRCITGICSFSLPLIIPIYVAEISESDIRGMLISGFVVMMNLGALFVYTMGFFLSWRYVTGSCALIPIIGHILMSIVPESPSYLIARDKQQEAKKSLMWLRGATTEEDIKTEYLKLVDSFNMCNDGHNSGWNWKYFKDAATLKPTLVGILLVTLMQTTFYNVIMAASVQVFETAGSSHQNKYLYTIVLGVIQLMGSFIPSFIVDKVGRRVLLILGLTGTFLSMGTLGAYFYVERIDKTIAHARLSWLPFCSLVANSIVESVGVTSVIYIIIGEITPPKTKGLSGAILGIWNRFTGFTMLFIYRDLIYSFGNDGTYFIIASVNLLGVILCYFVVPETKGKSLEDINAHYSS